MLLPYMKFVFLVKIHFGATVEFLQSLYLQEVEFQVGAAQADGLVPKAVSQLLKGVPATSHWHGDLQEV